MSVFHSISGIRGAVAQTAVFQYFRHAKQDSYCNSARAVEHNGPVARAAARHLHPNRVQSANPASCLASPSRSTNRRVRWNFHSGGKNRCTAGQYGLWPVQRSTSRRPTVPDRAVRRERVLRFPLDSRPAATRRLQRLHSSSTSLAAAPHAHSPRVLRPSTPGPVGCLAERGVIFARWPSPRCEIVAE